MKKILLYVSIGLAVVFFAGIAAFQYSRSWENSFFLDPLHTMSTDEKTIALTFDDGPSDARTPQLLDLLDAHNVQATFFMLGKNIEKYPEIAQDVYERGHLIGNHSYDHPRLIFKTPSFMRNQITRTNQLITSTGQKNVDFFRPPYSSKFIVLPLVLRSLNKTLVTGTYDPPSQYISPFNAENVANEVIENTKPGSIIYLHDGNDSDPEQFTESVGLIITALKEKGYKFVRLDYEK